MAVSDIDATTSREHQFFRSGLQVGRLRRSYGPSKTISIRKDGMFEAGWSKELVHDVVNERGTATFSCSTGGECGSAIAQYKEARVPEQIREALRFCSSYVPHRSRTV